MKRFFGFLLLFLVFGINSIASQDQLLLRNGGSMIVEIIEKTSTSISYRHINSVNGSIHYIHLSGVQSIIYSNGTREKNRVGEGVYSYRTQTQNQVVNSTINESKGTQSDSRRSTSRQTRERGSNERERNSAPVLGTPTPFQQIINAIPAITIPLVGQSFKFNLGGDIWIAKVNGENYLAGNCILEETSNGYIINLKVTHVWTGAIEGVIDFLEKAGIPLGPAAMPLRTAARLVARAANWIPLNMSTFILEYNETVPVRLTFNRIKR